MESVEVTAFQRGAGQGQFQLQRILALAALGFGQPGEVVRLAAGDEAACEANPDLHSGGLLYLLRALPFLGITPLPEICLIGIEGEGDEAVIGQAADRALEAVYEIP